MSRQVALKEQRQRLKRSRLYVMPVMILIKRSNGVGIAGAG